MLKLMFAAAAALTATAALAQDAAAPATPALPFCSATVTDSCQQTAAQQARAMTGAQADARDARNGGQWTPDVIATKTTTTTTRTRKKTAG